MAKGERSRLIWRSIPWYFKLAGGVVLGGGTYMLLRKKDRPPKMLTKPASYIENGVVVEWSPTPLANELYQSMHGTNYGALFQIAGDNEKAWRKLFNVASPGRVKAVSSEYSRIASSNKDTMTMIQRIRDESSTIGSVKDSLLIKLDAIGIQ